MSLYGLLSGLTTIMGKELQNACPFFGRPSWPIAHHVMNFPGGQQWMPRDHGLKGFHAVCANRDWSLWEQRCSHSTPRKPPFPGPCKQAVNCGSHFYTLMYCGTEAWGFCLKRKSKSLHLFSALDMLVSEDISFPDSPEWHTRGFLGGA